MKVYIANFGRENRFWDVCHRDSVITAYEDDDTWPLWRAGDRDAYVAHCLVNKLTARGIAPNKPTASRWFNIPTLVSNTTNDLWLHREKDELWWTTSSDEPVSVSRVPAPWANPTTTHVHVLRKPAAAWRDADRRGAPLRWGALHARAREFLFTEGTLQELAADNADYARALVAGDPLESWHSRPDWVRRAAAAGHGAVTTFDARKRSVARMVQTAEDTVKASQGPATLQQPKRKRSTFTNAVTFQKYVHDLIDSQDGRCAITEIPLQFDDATSETDFLCSLDRIDSDGDYSPGNLQVVCRFVNRWKGSDPDDAFRRLMDFVRGRAPS